MPESEKYISYAAAKWHLYRELITDKEAAKKAFSALSAIPAADVREVVYCRECKHYKPQEKKSARWENRSLMCTRSATIKMPPDGFCSFGEKADVTDINVGDKREAE